MDTLEREIILHALKEIAELERQNVGAINNCLDRMCGSLKITPIENIREEDRRRNGE